MTVTDGVVHGRDRDIPIRDYVPSGTAHATPFLWVHGGGFAYGGIDVTESTAPARYLAEAGWRVRTLDYRLAPQIGLFKKPTLGAAPGRFPEAHHDVLDVAASMGAPFTIGGASAGANLVAGAVLAMRDAKAQLPMGVALVYGLLHGVLPDDPALEATLRGPLARWFFNPGMTSRMNVNYVGHESGLADPYAFPGGADLTGFPPTITLDASNDRLRRSGHAFSVELAAAGVETEEVVVQGIHGFLTTPKKKSFAMGMTTLADWLARRG